MISLITTTISIFFILWGLVDFTNIKYSNTAITRINFYKDLALILIGTGLLLLYLAFRKLSLQNIYPYAFLGITLIFSLFYIKIPKWFPEHNEEIDNNLKENNQGKKGHKKIWLAVIILLSLISGYIITSYMPEKKFDQGTLTVSGIYGLSKTTKELIVIDTVSSIPNTCKTIDGVSLFNIKKGKFEIKDSEKCEMFLYTNKPPFIYIEYRRANKLYINFVNSEDTRKLYQLLRITKDKGILP